MLFEAFFSFSRLKFYNFYLFWKIVFLKKTRFFYTKTFSVPVRSERPTDDKTSKISSDGDDEARRSGTFLRF